MRKHLNRSNNRILLVLPEAFSCAGGIQMFCRALCLAAGNWAHENGALVSALVLNDNSAPDARYINSDFVSYVGTGKSKAKFTWHYLSQILASKYDWIIFGHVSLSPLALLARLFSPRVKTGIVTYGIEVWRPLTRVQRLALRHADVVLAISDYTREEVIKHNSIKAEKVRIFPCTLDPHWKATIPVEKIECESSVMLSVTRMSKDDKYKGIDNVIRSMPAILSEVGPVEYRVVGQGDDVPRLRALAAGLGVSRYVKFMGSISDAELREQYRRCSLFVLPSRKEGFGIVFLEAMAFGKPVIGGAHGGTLSVIKDGKTGLLTDNSDVEGIARAVTKLLSDEGMREKLGRAGHDWLLNTFTFEKFEQNLQEVLRPRA